MGGHSPHQKYIYNHVITKLQLVQLLEHHAGGYAPRQPARKLRGLSYSRSVLAVHMPDGDGVSEAPVSNVGGVSVTQQQPLNQSLASFAFAADSR